MRVTIISFSLIAALGCESGNLSQGRPDSGAVAADAGDIGPLLLEPGMVFRYSAFLTGRRSANDERESGFTLDFTITEVEDNQAERSSTVTVTATGALNTTLFDNWEITDDFDTWVGRSGPTIIGDTVSDGPVTVELDDAPPPVYDLPQPNAKQLPQALGFFIDVRRIDVVRQAFLDENVGRNPQIQNPTDQANYYQFTVDAPDPGIIYYRQGVQTNRQIIFLYNPIGYLEDVTDRVGDSANTPRINARLQLTEGP